MSTIKPLTWMIALVSLLAGLPAAAFELTIQTANDPVAGNRKPDDLYTAALGFEVALAAHTWSVGERMFTDRERNLRFDETFLEMARELPEWHGWSTEVGAGVLHVGHGLLGERVQNEVHRWVGSERVELAYVEDSHWYATGRVRLERLLAVRRASQLAVRFDADAAPGFQNSLRAEVLGDVRLSREIALRAGLGMRSAQVESALLGNRIDDLGATWELGVAWRDWTLRYSFNDHGTRASNLALAVKLGSERGRRGD